MPPWQLWIIKKTIAKTETSRPDNAVFPVVTVSHEKPSWQATLFQCWFTEHHSQGEKQLSLIYSNWGLTKEQESAARSQQLAGTTVKDALSYSCKSFHFINHQTSKTTSCPADYYYFVILSKWHSHSNPPWSNVFCPCWKWLRSHLAPSCGFTHRKNDVPNYSRSTG